MAAQTALATVSFFLKPLLRANGETAKRLCGIAVCCIVKGECSYCRCRIHPSSELFGAFYELLIISLFVNNPMAINILFGIIFVCFHKVMRFGDNTILQHFLVFVRPPHHSCLSPGE